MMRQTTTAFAVLVLWAMGGLESLGDETRATSLPLQLKQVRTVALTLTDCRGIAIGPGDALYVAGTEGVQMFDAQGHKIRLLKTSQPARCVAVDGAGMVSVGLDQRVERFDAGGARLNAFGAAGKEPGQLGLITGIATTGDFIFIADAAHRRIHRFSALGEFVDDLEGFGIPSPYFPCAVDSNGNLYVSHTGKRMVEVYDGNLKRMRAWGRWGAGPGEFFGCCNPAHLAVFADGRVATSDKVLPRIQVFSAEGELLAFLGTEAFDPDEMRLALAIDSQGRLAALVSRTPEVRYYELVNARSE